MQGFHIDMNTAQFTRSYIEKWLRYLASKHYDTILWEVENNIAWETCPECASPDAFSKAEFREILTYADTLGFNNIPLFQTIGHCEYVLKHEEYKPFAELPNKIDQYCPRNESLLPFLTAWIEEYFEVFERPEYFHIGADEAWHLGSCDKCQEYVKAHSLSELYIHHINSVAKPIFDRGIKPIIWADMVLHHPEAIDKLDRRFVLFDWMYEINNRCDKVKIWGINELCDKSEIPSNAHERFGKYLFPDNSARMESFYTFDYLWAQGFDRVVTCPASASYRDTVFLPRTEFHMLNTWDSFRKGNSRDSAGSVLTSWTCHLFPWELQLTSIDMPDYQKRQSAESIESYKRAFAEEHFGFSDDRNGEFWRAVNLLGRSIRLGQCGSLGMGKHCNDIPKDYFFISIDTLAKEGCLEAELSDMEKRLVEYRQGLAIVKTLLQGAEKGLDELQWWVLGSENLILHTECSLFLVKHKMNLPTDEDPEELFKRLERQKKITGAAYTPILNPTRRKEIIRWLYDSVTFAVETFIHSYASQDKNMLSGKI
jgi:hypothetical protein